MQEKKKVVVYIFYYSNKSKAKVVHYKGCHHLKNIKAKNLGFFDCVKDILKKEYRIFLNCSPITKQLKKEQAQLENFCQENGLSYFINKGNLHIETYCSKWKILISDNKDVFELHHKNSFEKEHTNSVPGYHMQNYKSNTIIGYMEYIINHEHYRMYNPVQIFTKKEPPAKGSKHRKRQQKAIKKKERKRKIRNFLNLINSLSSGVCAAHT